MPSQRLQKVNELVKQELNNILIKEIDFFKDVLVTINFVDSAPDLKNAKVGISVLPADKSKSVIKFLKNKKTIIQKILNKKLVMHYVPRIHFIIDEIPEKANEMEKLLDSLKT